MSASIAYKICPDNIIEDWGAMQDWSAGTNIAPTGWSAFGTAGSIAQETVNIMAGVYSMKINGGASATYAARIIYTPATPQYSGQTLTMGCWVMCSTANVARIAIFDGITTTYSTYHTGDGTWQFLTVTVQIDPNNTALHFICQMGANHFGYFANAIVCVGPNVFTYLQALASYVYARPENTKVNIPSSVNTFDLARKEGSFVQQTKPTTRTTKLQVQLVGDTLAQVRPQYDQLITAIHDGLKDLYMADDRLSKVYLSTISQIAYQVNQNIYTVDIEFIAGAPYEQYIGRLREMPAVAGLTTNFNFNYSGNYKTRPRLTIAAAGLTIGPGWSVTNFTSVENMGYSGTILPGTCLVVDMENQTVENNGVDDTGNYNGDFFSLVPGQNYLQFAGATPAVYLDYFPRFI